MSYTPATRSRYNGANTAKSYGAIADGTTHPLSGAFGSLAAAQAFYPNGGVTALTQEIDTCAILQLDHDFAGGERVLDQGNYMIDQLISFGTTPGAGGTTRAQGGVVRGQGGAGSGAGTRLIAKPGAGLTAVVALDAGDCHYKDFTADANNYTLGGSSTAVSTGLGATHSIWCRNCAVSQCDNLGVAGFKQFGFWNDTSTGGISDGAVFTNPAAVQGGTPEIQSLTCTATSGNFTLTVTNYLGSQTTGNIAFNASAATVIAALNALATVAPVGDQAGVGGGNHCFSNLSQFLPANTAGPLGTNPVYIMFAGALMGPQAGSITVNQGTLAGGVAAIAPFQAGLVSAMIGWGGGSDNNINHYYKPRASGMLGDCILFNGGINTQVFGVDFENNWCCGIRWSGCDSSPATTLTGNAVFWGYCENNWQSYYLDQRITNGTRQIGGLLMRTNMSGTGSLKVQPGQASGIIEMAMDTGVIVINGSVLTVP